MDAQTLSILAQTTSEREAQYAEAIDSLAAAMIEAQDEGMSVAAIARACEMRRERVHYMMLRKRAEGATA